MPPETSLPQEKKKLSLPHWQAGFFIFLIILIGWYISSISAPKHFPAKTIITVQEGSGLLKLTDKLESDQVIRSAFWFRIIAITLGGERGMQAGDYYFEKPANAIDIAWRIVHGYHGLETVKVTIPEGFTVEKIANLFDSRFKLFDKEVFLSLAPEGYMFPDTYFIQVNATASSTIRMFRDNFIRKIFPIIPEIDQSGHSLEEIITMASIIESEAQSKEDKEMVSGILWSRIQKKIPLQVDATLTYLTHKTSAELTVDDLKLDSPFNTYVHSGLPPEPISNPGIEAIEAAVQPTASLYMYFLTGDDGKMHYAKTFEEHKQNKAKYLAN
jgi:UPF0755 protein